MTVITSQVVNNTTLYTATKTMAQPGVTYIITKQVVNGMVLNTLEKRTTKV